MNYLLLIWGFFPPSLIRSRYRETNPSRRTAPFATTAPVISSTPRWRFSRLAYAPPPLQFLLPNSFCNRMQLDACAHCATRCKYHCATDSARTGPLRKHFGDENANEALGRTMYTSNSSELCRHAHTGRLNSSTALYLRESSHRPQHSSGEDDVKSPWLLAHSDSFVPIFTRF